VKIQTDPHIEANISFHNNFANAPPPHKRAENVANFFTVVPACHCGVIKTRRMRWAGHVARLGEERGCIGSWWGNRREGDHWEDLGVDGWIILGWISRRWDAGIWTGLGWPRVERVGGRL